MKSKTADLIIQIISVTIGVFLGFMVSNWSENQKETRRYEALLTNLRAEIRENHSRVMDVLGYHEMLRDSARHFSRNSHTDSRRPGFFKGVNTCTFVNSAYETGVQTGLLNQMKLEEIQEINDLYAKQRAYEGYANMMLSGFITLDFGEQGLPRMYNFLAITMTDVVIKEGELLHGYERALAFLEE